MGRGLGDDITIENLSRMTADEVKAILDRGDLSKDAKDKIREIAKLLGIASPDNPYEI
jgi:flagellar basal body-associated protein FliL